MKYFEVGFQVSENIFSINTICANTGEHELEAVTETAQRRAEQHHYSIAYIKEISYTQADEAARRGRPCYMIDDEAEQKYDPSFHD